MLLAEIKFAYLLPTGQTRWAFLFPKYRYLCFVAGGSPAGYSLSGDSVCVVVQRVRSVPAGSGSGFKSRLRIKSFQIGFFGVLTRFADCAAGFFIQMLKFENKLVKVLRSIVNVCTFVQQYSEAMTRR